MKVGLFVPCYIDQFYPNVAIATLELLEKSGCEVLVPGGATCCGQPMANAGFEHLSGSCNRHFLDSFSGLEYIVCPSGSCTLHLRQHLKVIGREVESKTIRSRVYELTDFLTGILKIERLNACFPHRTGLHQSCHGQRGLHLSQMSELVAPDFSKPMQLLRLVSDIEIIELDRRDECCGFGGTFCVTEDAVSAKMGKDRIKDHIQQGAEYITGVDMSCLMHLEAILKRQGQPVKVKHIAEILNAGEGL